MEKLKKKLLTSRREGDRVQVSMQKGLSMREKSHVAPEPTFRPVLQSHAHRGRGAWFLEEKWVPYPFD